MPSLLKDKVEKSFPKISAPHLFAAHFSAQMVWGFCAALIPIWMAGVAAYGFDAVRVFVLTVGFSCGLQYVFGRKSWLQAGNAAFAGGLLALLLPAQVPWQGIALGSLAASLVGQMAFGGLGQNIFHPALVGYAALFLLAPEWFFQGEERFVHWSQWFLIRQSASLGTTSFFAIILSAAVLLYQRWISRLAPFLYLAALGGLSVCLGRNPFDEWVNSSIFLAAFFFLADPVTTPITRKGQVTFAVAAAFLTALLRFWAAPLPAALGSIFFLNGFVPILDRYPARADKNESVTKK